jgi:hypothetical protein
MVHNQLCFDGFTICYRGQFLVSAQRIRANRAIIYRRLLTGLEYPDDHVIHQDGKVMDPPQSGNANNPLMGHTMERAWTFIFNCHRPNDPEGHQKEYVDGTRDCRCVEDPVDKAKPGDPGSSCSHAAMVDSCQCVDRVHHTRAHPALPDVQG